MPLLVPPALDPAAISMRRRTAAALVCEEEEEALEPTPVALAGGEGTEDAIPLLDDGLDDGAGSGGRNMLDRPALSRSLAPAAPSPSIAASVRRDEGREPASVRREDGREPHASLDDSPPSPPPPLPTLPPPPLEPAFGK